MSDNENVEAGKINLDTNLRVICRYDGHTDTGRTMHQHVIGSTAHREMLHHLIPLASIYVIKML